MSSSDANAALKVEKLFSVDGLVAVITGGGSGLGSYMARALALNGAAHIFILGRREPSLSGVASSVPTNNIHPIVCDVTSKSSLSVAVSQIRDTHGITAIDVLIANSGISGPSVATVDPQTQRPVSVEDLVANLWKPEVDDVTETYKVNVTGVHFTVAAFLPLLVEANNRRPVPAKGNFRARPQIITTASIGGYNRKPLGNLSYGPSKAAVLHLSKQLSTTLVPYDIRCNTIAPGLYLSEMTGGMYDRQGKTETHNVEGTWPRDVIPATRGGDEEDMAGTVLWLCSRAGAYVSGCVVVTDGGRLGVVPNSY